jgi:ribosomal protein S17E
MVAEKFEQTPESDQFLATVDARIAALQQLRSSYVAAVSIGAFGQPGDPAAFGAGPVGAGGTMNGAPMELPRGALLGKSLPAAIKLYLSAVKRKQSIKQIAAALREHGVESMAKNFETPIQSAVYRMREAGELLRFDDGWALAEFYPENLRNRIAEKNTKPVKKAKKRTAKRKAAKAPKTQMAPGDSTAEPAGNLDVRILAYLQQRGGPAMASDVAGAMGVAPNVAGLALGRLKKQERVTKGADGAYAPAA